MRSFAWRDPISRNIFSKRAVGPGASARWNVPRKYRKAAKHLMDAGRMPFFANGKPQLPKATFFFAVIAPSAPHFQKWEKGEPNHLGGSIGGQIGFMKEPKGRSLIPYAPSSKLAASWCFVLPYEFHPSLRRRLHQVQLKRPCLSCDLKPQKQQASEAPESLLPRARLPTGTDDLKFAAGILEPSRPFPGGGLV